MLPGVRLAYRRDVRLVRSTMVVGHESVELQGVELKAGVVDVLHILHGVLVHGQQGGGLEDKHTEREREHVNEPHPLYIVLLGSGCSQASPTRYRLATLLSLPASFGTSLLSILAPYE